MRRSTNAEDQETYDYRRLLRRLKTNPEAALRELGLEYDDDGTPPWPRRNRSMKGIVGSRRAR